MAKNNQRHKLYTLNDVLENIDYFTDDDQGPKRSQFSVFITPPDDNGCLTDEDSADEETDEFDINHLGSKLLNAEAEVCNFQSQVRVIQVALRPVHIKFEKIVMTKMMT